MSKKRAESKPAERPPRTFADRLESGWKLLVVSLFEFLGQFGFPGIVLMLVYFFVTNYASAEQKRELIDAYFLFKGENSGIFGTIIFCIFGIVVFVGTRVHYRRQLRLKDEEIDRIAEEKTKLQQKALKHLLHTSKSKKERK